MRPLRAIPSDLGRLRAANYVYRHRFEGTNGDLQRTQLSDGSRFALEVSEWPQAQAFLAGEYDRATVDFLTSNLPPGGVYVEAGAHVGLVVFQVLARTQGVQVHAFEPHPKRGEQFRRNAALNGAEDQVTLNPVGLSNANTSVPYSLDWHTITDADDSIDVLRLDDYLDEHDLDRVGVMKMDIEGHELQALEGAERALSEQRIRALTMEAMDNHADTSKPRALLEGYGYRRVSLPDTQLGRLRSALGKPVRSMNDAYLAP